MRRRLAMTFRVIFHAEARDEAIEAAAYIAAQGFPETAQAWYESLDRVVDQLGCRPRRYPPAREATSNPGEELRQVIFSSYRIVFAVRGQSVHVLHVRHASREDTDVR